MDITKEKDKEDDVGTTKFIENMILGKEWYGKVILEFDVAFDLAIANAYFEKSILSFLKGRPNRKCLHRDRELSCRDLSSISTLN